ncbi:type VI secretion system Vgr family protein [Serratia microhaemolytica]|uniref:type VI secretion system Vgr family protein n=1 Tax=Serratia microhaemolytica TaxID=2675110 RepID=UPI000FDF2C0A|nr:type VI secretion system tip protein VgrG [Serratia microhaemolytica]
MMTNSSTPVLKHLYQLAIPGNLSTLDVLAFQSEEALSQPFNYTIDFTSSNQALTAEQLLMKPGSFTLQISNGGRSTQCRIIYGVITHFRHLANSKDQGHYQICLQPRLALLRQNRQHAIYQHCSVPEIVEQVLRERLKLASHDFVFQLRQKYPKRLQVMQYGEDDLRFISRLLAEVGISFRFLHDSRLRCDLVEFSDHAQQRQAAINLPMRTPGGLHSSRQAAVWQLSSHHQVVEQSVTTHFASHDSNQQPMAQADLSNESSTTYGEAYHYADSSFSSAPEPLESGAESSEFYAQLHHQRYLNQQARFSALSDAIELAPGQRLLVSDAHLAAFTRGVLIVRTRAHARRDSHFELTLEAIPAKAAYHFRPELISKPQMAGTLAAHISSTNANDIYAHLDQYGRYRVKMHFDRQRWPQGEESLWVRLARPYAGNQHGLHLPLLAGTEVAIAFENGDPDRPYIAHALHDVTQPDPVTLNNYKYNVLRTPAGNQLQLHDQREQQHISLSTDYGGKSQLNLGHLVNADQQQRGEGFELRTDRFGAIRAQQGIFISAEGQPQAEGAMLAMQPTLDRLQQAQQLSEALSQAAQSATAEPAQLQAQIDLLEQRLEQLQSAVLLLSAPQGAAISSGEHLQMSASKNLIATAGEHADVSVLKNFFIGVGQRLNIYIRKLGMKLIASEGPILMQAHNGMMDLMARGAIQLGSTEDEIRLVAHKKITITAGGSYLMLDGQNIEIGTNGTFEINSAQVSQQSPCVLSVTMPNLPATPNDIAIAALAGSAAMAADHSDHSSSSCSETDSASGNSDSEDGMDESESEDDIDQEMANALDEDKIIYASTLVHFEPTEQWQGDFGFDWLRIKMPHAPYFQKPYRDLIGVIVMTPEGDLVYEQDHMVYLQFSYQYKNYLVRWLRDKAEREIRNVSFPKPLDSTLFHYHSPVMTLLPGKSAQLAVTLQQEENHRPAEKIVFRFGEDNTLTDPDITVTGNIVVNPDVSTRLEINCHAEFDEDKRIRAFAVNAEGEEQLAGEFFIKANDERHRRTIDLILVKCVTRMEYQTRDDDPFDISSSKQQLTNILNQFYVIPNFIELTVDLTANPLFKDTRYFTFSQDTRATYFNHLKHLIKGQINQLSEIDFEYAYKLYFFNVSVFKTVFNENNEAEKEVLEGIARDIGGREAFVYQLGLYNKTAAHELLHCLSLQHPFSLFSPFAFKDTETDNIMDYDSNEPEDLATSTDGNMGENAGEPRELPNIPKVASWQFQWAMVWQHLQQEQEQKLHQQRLEQQQQLEQRQREQSPGASQPLLNTPAQPNVARRGSPKQHPRATPPVDYNTDSD